MLLSSNCFAVAVDNALRVSATEGYAVLANYYYRQLDTREYSPPRDSYLEWKHYKEWLGWYARGMANMSSYLQPFPSGVPYYYVFEGCTANGTPIDFTHDFSLYTGGDLINGYYRPYYSPGSKQLIGETTSEENAPLKYVDLKFPWVDTVKLSLEKEYLKWMPAGTYNVTCRGDIYQDQMLNVGIWWTAVFTTQWWGGGQPTVGWSPSIINVQANNVTGDFTATSTITMPVIKGGRLVLTSTDPIIVDFGAGPSSEASEIFTTFSESGIATGAVKIMGRVREPGKRVYNIRAESIYE